MFQTFSMFLENEVIKNKTAMLATVTFSLYKEEFHADGGTQDDMNKYSVQGLMSNVNERFENILIDKLTNKSGTFVFHSLVIPTEAVAMLNDSNDKVEEIRCAAMALRKKILAMPPPKTSSPTSIVERDQSQHASPGPLVLPYPHRWLQVEPELRHSRDVIERKTLSSASDAVLNYSRGAVRPWKHQALGLGLGTLAGSKSLLSILNCFVQCISYNELKQLETEIAYTCSDGGRETHAGLNLYNGLGTTGITMMLKLRYPTAKTHCIPWWEYATRKNFHHRHPQRHHQLTWLGH